MVLISLTHRFFISHIVQYSKTSWQINYMYYVHFLNLFDLIVFSKFIFSWSLIHLYIIVLDLVIQTTQKIIKGFTQNNMTLQYQIITSIEWIELRELLLCFPSLWVLYLVTYCYCLLLLLSNHMFEVLRWQSKNTFFFFSPQLLLVGIHKMMKIEYQVDWIWSRTWRHGTTQDLDFGAILERALGAKNSPGLTT